jgi:hypothetical protein
MLLPSVSFADQRLIFKKPSRQRIKLYLSAHEPALHLHGEVVEAVRLRRSGVARTAILKILDAAFADLGLCGSIPDKTH